MSPRLSWRQVIPGLIAVAILSVIVVAVIAFGGVGKVRGAKQDVLIVTAHARGLINGSEVWLAGQKIGTVERMDFLAPTADSQARLLVIAKVIESAAAQIRRDSKVRIRASGSIVGPIVVWIEPGTPTSPAITERDTLHAQTASELEIAGAKAAKALDELPPLVTDAKRVIAQVKDPDGVRSVLSGPAMSEAKRLMANLNRMQRPRDATGERGELMSRAGSLLARVDSIRALLASPDGNLGRFRRDSTLPRAVADVRDQLAGLQARMDSTTGTLDRFARDSAITHAVADARREMALLFADLKKHPMRYIAF